jgi:hypothetical protein
LLVGGGGHWGQVEGLPVPRLACSPNSAHSNSLDLISLTRVRSRRRTRPMPATDDSFPHAWRQRVVDVNKCGGAAFLLLTLSLDRATYVMLIYNPACNTRSSSDKLPVSAVNAVFSLARHPRDVSPVTASPLMCVPCVFSGWAACDRQEEREMASYLGTFGLAVVPILRQQKSRSASLPSFVRVVAPQTDLGVNIVCRHRSLISLLRRNRETQHNLTDYPSYEVRPSAVVDSPPPLFDCLVYNEVTLLALRLHSWLEPRWHHSTLKGRREKRTTTDRNLPDRRSQALLDISQRPFHEPLHQPGPQSKARGPLTIISPV